MKQMLLNTPFSLRLTLESGQFFQWKEKKGYYRIRSRDTLFDLCQDGDTLYYDGIAGSVTPEYLSRFFRLDDPLDRIFSTWSDDPVLRSAYGRYRGLRLIRQDPWECLICFVCSMASNIPRITGNIATLSERFGTAYRRNGEMHHRLPTPEQLAQASLDELYGAGVGFRAKYLHAIASQVADGFSLHELSGMSYPDAKNALTRFHGIGDKVADCILLFSLDHLEAFPTDTWILKQLHRYYFESSIKSPAKLSALARERFGAYAGYAQQYLFHYARTGFKDES